MPTEDIKPEDEKTFVKTADSKWKEIKGAKCIKVTSVDNDDAIDSMKYIDNKKEETITFNISRESSIKMQKMIGINKISRKRFIKLLMGCRIQRNDATKFADIVRKTEFCYCPLMVQVIVEWCIRQMEG